MADHPDARAVDLGPPDEIVDRAARVPHVLALEGLALRQAVEGLVALVFGALQAARRVPALVEADRVGRERDVAPPSELEGIVLIGGQAEARGAVLADVEFASVLVMAEHRGQGRRAGLGQEQEGRDALIPLDRVRDLLADDVAEVDALPLLGSERRGQIGHGAEEPHELATVEGGHGRCGGRPSLTQGRPRKKREAGADAT